MQLRVGPKLSNDARPLEAALLMLVDERDYQVTLLVSSLCGVRTVRSMDP
jgi:hypothetical protein